MKKKDILNLHNNLNKLGALKGVKFAYAVSRNITKTKPEVEALQNSLKATEKFEEFDNKRIELAKDMSEKDDKGKPVIIGNEFKMEDMDKFNVELEKLKEKYKEEVTAREEQYKDYTALMEEETNIELYNIKLSDVPEDISSAQMNTISELIEEEK